MNLRKLVYIPTGKQLLKIKSDYNAILDKCNEIAQSEHRDQLEAKKIHDGQCPVCKSKSNIIDRIADVHSKSRVGGTIRAGFGSVNGMIIIETEAINHCKCCENEWKKFKTKFITPTDILRVALNYLNDILSNPEEEEKGWKKDAVEVFNGCCAEAIYHAVIENEDYLKAETVKKLTLRQLRKYYLSIFDAKL